MVTENKIICVRNWEKFQHYKFRNPPWIKLHSMLLDDYEWRQLSDNSKLLLFHLWMLASRYQNAIPYDLEFVKSKLPIKTEIDLSELAQSGYLIIKSTMSQHASNALASCKQNADSETENRVQSREEKYTLSSSEKQQTQFFNPESEIPANFRETAKRILTFLTQITKRNYRIIEPNLKPIIARLRTGVTEKQCEQVIGYMYNKWRGDPEKAQYLRPSTLFRPTNFENYLAEAMAKYSRG